MNRCKATKLMMMIVSTSFMLPLARAQDAIGATRIDDLLEEIRAKHKVPALAAAIVTNKGLHAIGACGVRKAETDVPVTIDDKWHLGSDTKAMTAMLIAALVEQEKLKWETTIEQVFPEIAETLPTDLRGVTILHLLSHHSGLPANTQWGIFSLAGSLIDQRQMVLKSAASITLESKAGTKFGYSNWGYVIAGAMAEQVTKTKWEDLIAESLFKPLEMKSAGFGGTGTPGKVDQPWGHFANGKPVAGNGPTVDNPPVIGPAGTVHCSLADWAKVIADQLRGARGERSLLKPETYKILHTPPFGGEPALGWIVTHRNWGGRVLTHAGSNTMNFAVAWVAPERGFAVLVCTNQGGDGAAKACDDAAASLIRFHTKK